MLIYRPDLIFQIVYDGIYLEPHSDAIVSERKSPSVGSFRYVVKSRSVQRKLSDFVSLNTKLEALKSTGKNAFQEIPKLQLVSRFNEFYSFQITIFQVDLLEDFMI